MFDDLYNQEVILRPLLPLNYSSSARTSSSSLFHKVEILGAVPRSAVLLSLQVGLLSTACGFLSSRRFSISLCGGNKFSSPYICVRILWPQQHQHQYGKHQQSACFLILNKSEQHWEREQQQISFSFRAWDRKSSDSFFPKFPRAWPKR